MYPTDLSKLLFDTNVEDDNCKHYETLTDGLNDDLSSSTEEESDFEYD